MWVSGIDFPEVLIQSLSESFEADVSSVLRS